MKSRLVIWAVALVAAAWYVCFCASLCGALGRWWLWAAPFWIVFGLVGYGRFYNWRERRRLDRRINRAFLNGVGVSRRPEKPSHSRPSDANTQP